MLFSSDCVPNQQGLQSIKFVEIDGLYPALLIQLDDPTLMTSNTTPFKEPTPFGVEPRQRLRAPPSVHTLSFAHSTDFQSAAEILREGQIRPSSLPTGAKELPCVVYGAGTPGALSEWSLQVCASQLLKKPKGRQDAILVGSFSGVQPHCKASWGSVQDEAWICRRRGIFRNQERWAAHAGHLWIQALLIVVHNR